MNDFTKTIAEHEAAQGKERLAREDHPAYSAVLIAAANVDMDRDSLVARADRIAKEAHDLAAEAIRVRDQHEAQIAAMQSQPASTYVVTSTPTPAPPSSTAPFYVPPTLVHWIRRQIAMHPVANDSHPILLEPNVTLGELRAFLASYDGGKAP